MTRRWRSGWGEEAEDTLKMSNKTTNKSILMDRRTTVSMDDDALMNWKLIFKTDIGLSGTETKFIRKRPCKINEWRSDWVFHQFVVEVSMGFNKLIRRESLGRIRLELIKSNDLKQTLGVLITKWHDNNGLYSVCLYLRTLRAKLALLVVLLCLASPKGNLDKTV